ncbi:hypothetical protein HPB48_022237 [Haemaphysalis longicornis]|uniref:Transposable element P transposase n=1 Tax=Haemaphysalis longicornis TaxID=44386 RepID=A0A9J6FR24_HAELO|nr:hypothetical protein HPB48_022237 [Haemaphysalis longicornis]
MEICASSRNTKCSAPHSVDPERRLHFLSDFPHLIKCLRNGLLTSDYILPQGDASPNSHTDQMGFAAPWLVTRKNLCGISDEL